MSSKPAEHFAPGDRIKGAMARAHLLWAARSIPDHKDLLTRSSSADHARLLTRPVLATEWLPFETVVGLARAIAAAAVEVGAGAPEDAVYAELGAESARQNISGTYRSFRSQDPHRFFANMAFLHGRFQSFGRSSYEPTGPRAGTLRIDELTSFSPVHCLGEAGYLRESLLVLGISLEPRVAERRCTCRGDEACVFELRW